MNRGRVARFGYRVFFTHVKSFYAPAPSSSDFGFVDLVTALALLESGSEFTPGPAGPGNRMITWYLEPRLWKRRCVSHSSIFVELAVCVAEQQRQQCRDQRRSVLGSSIQRHVRWRWILCHRILHGPCAVRCAGHWLQNIWFLDCPRNGSAAGSTSMW